MALPTLEGLRESIVRLGKLNPGRAVELGASHPLYKIWLSAWNDPDSLFDSNNGYPVLCIPFPTRVAKHFVRQEYVRAYEDALSLYQAVAERSVGVEEMKFETPKEDFVLTLDQATQNLRAFDPHPASQMVRRALIISGHPGIGKTMSLWYYLVRRLAVHEPVVYQDESCWFYIFHDCGVTCILPTPDTEDVMTALPFSTWCLVDSNGHLADPMHSIATADRFIIQTASGDAAKPKWPVKLALRHQLYILKPPSLEEAQIISHFQVDNNDKERVRQFYSDYGPSAWGFLASTIDRWEGVLQKAFRLIGKLPTLLHDSVTNPREILDDNPEILSSFFITLPGPKRHVPLVQVITEHVKDMFVNWAYERWDDDTARAFYRMVLVTEAPRFIVFPL